MRIRAFAVLSVCVFSSMLGMGIIVPLIPIYAENMGADGLWIGIIFASFSISQTVLMPFFGALSDRRGKKALLSIGLLAYAVMSLGYLYAGNIYQLTAVRLLHGAAGGMLLPIAQTYVGDLTPEGEEGKWMGYFNAAIFGGFGTGPILGGVLTQFATVSVTFYVMGGLNFLAFLLCLFYLPDVGTRHRHAGGNSASIKILAASARLRGLSAFQLAFALGRGMFMTFLPVFAVAAAMGTGQVGVLIGANVLLMSLLQFFSGRMVDAFERKRLVVIGGMVAFVPLAFIPLSGSFWPLLAVAALAAFGGALALPAASALAVEEGRRYGMGATMGAFNMAMSAGFAAGPIIGGLAMDAANVSGVFYLAAAVGVAGLVVFARLVGSREEPQQRASASEAPKATPAADRKGRSDG